jgi:molybdate transport system ATP-binding protein
MLQVSVHTRLGEFTLDAHWRTDAAIVALVGPSGSGKTLTLQCIAGLIVPDEGRIVCAGRVLYDRAAGICLRPQARRIGYVFQGYALFPHMTVLQNVAYGQKRDQESYGADRTQNDSRSRFWINRLGLAALQSRYPSQLSGGEQQRVALARALATDPDLLLLDEPLSALDAPLRRDLRAELAQTLREWGKITVLVTHDLGEAYQIADVVVLCEGGHTTDAVSKNDLLWNPSSERVARLVGARNILRGTIAETGDDSIVLDWRGGRLAAARSPSHALHARQGDSLSFFVRPEYVRLIRKDRAVADSLRHANVFRGEIVGDRDEGTTWVLFFKVAAPGLPSQGAYDLEIEIPKLVYERLNVSADRQWDVSVHPGSIQVLPSH